MEHTPTTLEAFDALVRQRVGEARDTCHELAWLTNGMNGQVIPAPTAHALLDGLGAVLWSLSEIVHFVPKGLANSLTDRRLHVIDTKGDPLRQVDAAKQALAAVSDALRIARAGCDAAQTAINEQYWRAGE